MSLLLAVIVQLLIPLNNGDTIPVACSSNFNSYPFCNTSLSIDDRVNNLISLLTLDEKALQLTARQSPYNYVARLGIPEYDWGANCIHGVQSRCGSNCPTIFPEPNALGATFNETLIKDMGAIIGLELRALWLEGEGEYHQSNLPHLGLDCWSPTINIGRDPRWGRMYEIPSEDPYWNGRYGEHYTLGLQNGSKTSKYYDPNYYQAIVTLKHFDAYSLECCYDVNGTWTNRHNFNAIVSPYMFEDTYLPAFQRAVQSGGAKGVMCSYNAVNGVPSCCNDFLLNTTLRNTWGFEGYVTSDSGAIHDIWLHHHYTTTESQGVIDALQATCDVNSGSGSTKQGNGAWGTGSPYMDMIPPTVNNGSLDIKYVNQALFNTFKLRFQLGLFDPIENQPYWKVPGSIINQQSHQDLNLFAARCTQTLLKNDGDVLPFDASQINSGNKVVGVIGPHYNASHDLLIQNAYTGQICIDGYDSVDCVMGVLQGINKYVTKQSNILGVIGCNDGTTCNTTAGFPAALNVANKSDYIILMMGIDLTQEHESSSGGDRTNISLPGYQQDLASQICLLGKPTVLVLVNGGMLGIDQLIYDCPAILESYYPGKRGAEAISDVLFGTFNPGGKLATTMYWSNYTQQSNMTEMDLTAGYGKTYKYWCGTKPLFSFGHGLSYTKFQFKMDTTSNGCDTTQMEYCVNITNIGNREGHETLFLFVYPPSDNIPSGEPAKKMIKKLINFDKYYLKKGQTKQFSYKLSINKDLILYNSKGEATLFAGNYTIEFSNGVDQNLKTIVTVTSTVIMGNAKLFPNYYAANQQL